MGFTLPTEGPRRFGNHKSGYSEQTFTKQMALKLCNEDGIWRDLLRNKYLKSQSLGQVYKKPGDSQFWTGLMGVKEDFLNLGRFALKSGVQN